MQEAFTRARANVVYAETKMNKASSRSHAIFQLRISKRERVFEAAKTGQKVECTIARPSLRSIYLLYQFPYLYISIT